MSVTVLSPSHMEVSSPPNYRRFSRPGPAPPSGGNELPAYSRRRATMTQPMSPPREPTEHVFELKDVRNTPWAVLKIFSSAKSPQSLPTFFEKENINGAFELIADRGDSIQAVTITISGRVITGAALDDSYTFLNHVVPIWSKSKDVPRIASPSEGAAGGKLLGHCFWPLSIPIPKTVAVSSGAGDVQHYRLPETFLERQTSASVQYDITVTVSRGMLRPDHQIKTAFGFVPNTRPEPPSMLRQLAYQQGSTLVGPDGDPEGWKTLRTVPIRGLMFHSKPVEARCTLSLARPLCYTRGTVVPCFLSIEGSNTSFLDLLSAPSSVVVSLRRRVRHYSRPSSSRMDVAWSESVSDVGQAIWWQAVNNPSSATARHLEGEIRLSKDLRPTCAVGHFSISYSIVVCPFQAANYTSSHDLISEPVEIATMHAKGPRPYAYSPPAYDPITRRSDDFYATLSPSYHR